MKKLLRGIVEFRKNIRPTVKDTFARLALGQKPDTLFIACSDSRVVPNLFASSDPGDLLVIRNVGNLIAPCNGHEHTAPGASTGAGDDGEGAAIELALLTLSVTDIVVCGHSECTAMDFLMERRAPIAAPHLKAWLSHGKSGLARFKKDRSLSPHLEPHNRLSQINVLEQIENLKTYPLIAERFNAGNLRLHAWWFDIKEAEVFEYHPESEQFRLLDETYASQLLAQMSQT